MYVGVTYTGNGPYRSEVPAVSSRSLDSNSLFQVDGVKNYQVVKSPLFYLMASFNWMLDSVPNQN